jgi:hypothetical protein
VIPNLPAVPNDSPWAEILRLLTLLKEIVARLGDQPAR